MQKIIVLVLTAGLFSSCITTELVGSLKTSESEPVSYQKLGVVVLAPSMSNRSTVELALAEKFRAKGVKAVATFDIFPFAGKINEIKESGMSQEDIQKKIRERVGQNKLDGLLIVTLLDKQKETHYVEGSSFAVAAPVYGYPYYGYYSYAYTTVSNPGYYTTSTKYFVESNLYDVATEKLIWTGQTKTTDPASIEKESAVFADLIVNEVLAKKALKP